jgi:hypothetical protein
MCCCYDAPQPEFHSAVKRKARKRHQCCECRIDIRPGDHYESVAGKWEGELSMYKTCLPCVELRTKLAEDCGCWVYGGLYDDIAERLPYSDKTDPCHAWMNAYNARRQIQT